MIRRPTVLILGAGASAEYGFPVGRSLLLEIVRGLRGATRLKLDMQGCGFADDLINQFSSELEASNQPSVDAFLEQHKQNVDFEKLGKAAIAKSLILCEAHSTLRRQSELKLYEDIWHKASATPGTYPGNRLSILTFNYDRSLEKFLRSSLSASHPEFRNEGLEFERAVNAFPIFHLYGSLGALLKSDPSYLMYGGADHPALPPTILAASERIKLYHQAKFESSPLEQIRTAIQEAEIVCFLGFGFYPTNIKLLQFCDLGKNEKTKLYASALGLQRGQQEAARQALGRNVEFAPIGFKCLETLQDFPILLPT
jgi:hypothetical protein